MKKVVKSYYCSLLTILFALSLFIFLYFTSVTLATDEQNTPGCDCQPTPCRTTEPEDAHFCKSGEKIPPCDCKYGTGYYVCEKGTYQLRCQGIVVSSGGCSGGGSRPCTESDCKPHCLTRPGSCANCICPDKCRFKREIRNNGKCPTIYDDLMGDFLCTAGCMYDWL